MLQKGAMELVDQPSPSYYSQLFLVQKATGRWWPIIDLSALNGYVSLTRFWMETVASVLGSVRKGDMMFFDGLKDAYFQIPFIWILDHIYGLSWRGRCINSGFSFSACHWLPRSSLVFSLVSEWAHQWGIHLVWYLDNWLVVAQSLPLLLCHCDLLLQLCRVLS